MRYAPSLLAALIVGVTPPSMRSTESLTGRVVATHTGAPLPDATVHMDGVTREARTDSAGTFVLPGVPTGGVTVRARRVGFYAGRGTVSVDSASSAHSSRVSGPAASTRWRHSSCARDCSSPRR